MRKFRLSAAIGLLLFSSAIAGAGVMGTWSIAAHLSQLAAGDVTPAQATTSTQAFVDGGVPVRLRMVNQGAFLPASQAHVTFARGGQAILRTEEVAGGTVQARGLGAGAYSVFADGADGFAAFSTYIDPAADDQSAAVISVGLIPRGDLPTVRQLIERERSGESQPTPSLQDVSTRLQTSTQSLVHGSGLELSADGSLRGRAVRTARERSAALGIAEADVAFVQGNQVVAQSLTDEEGLFVVQGLLPGIYSLVITSHTAFVAIAVEVTPAGGSVAGEQRINEFSLASFDPHSQVPEASLIYEEDCLLVEECLVDEEPECGEEACCEGFAGGGGQGYGGGGGGGGAGGGGLGALLLGGAIGAGIYALVDDDDKKTVVSPQAP